jgi:hypothetical protein
MATTHKPPLLSLSGTPDPKCGRAETNPEVASTAVSSEGRLGGQARQRGGLEQEARDAGLCGGGNLVEFNAMKQVSEELRNSTSVLTTVSPTFPAPRPLGRAGRAAAEQEYRLF